MHRTEIVGTRAYKFAAPAVWSSLLDNIKSKLAQKPLKGSVTVLLFQYVMKN